MSSVLSYYKLKSSLEKNWRTQNIVIFRHTNIITARNYNFDSSTAVPMRFFICRGCQLSQVSIQFTPYSKTFGKPQAEVDFACVYNLLFIIFRLIDFFFNFFKFSSPVLTSIPWFDFPMKEPEKCFQEKYLYH